MNNFGAATMPAMLILACLLILTAGCGGGQATVTNVETHAVTVNGNTNTSANQRSTSVGSGPVMPNIDESAARTITEIAIASYERDWGDGSGVRAVWGPNISSGWALIGVENNSGAAGKDVLLQQENNTWAVKDIGHALSTKWQDQTPPDLWPSL